MKVTLTLEMSEAQARAVHAHLIRWLEYVSDQTTPDTAQAYLVLYHMRRDLGKALEEKHPATVCGAWRAVA